MRIFLLFIFTGVVIFAAGCCRPPDRAGDALAVVNNYQITKGEFEEEFRDSVYGQTDTPASRRDFLNNLINRKLILQYAEKKGLDKDKAFLRMVERFWEQSLLKLAIERKTKDLASSCAVSDREVRELYDRMYSSGDANKSYVDMYSQVKWEVSRRKESNLMNEWVDDLHKNTSIKINDDLLKSK
jgi:hypothetical protein